MSKSKDEGPMNRERASAMLQQLLQFGAASAIEQFDATSPVQRVELKANPARQHEFLFLAFTQDGYRFEGRLKHGMYHVDWCTRANCTCMAFARTRSPIEFGLTIDE